MRASVGLRLPYCGGPGHRMRLAYGMVAESVCRPRPPVSPRQHCGDVCCYGGSFGLTDNLGATPKKRCNEVKEVLALCEPVVVKVGGAGKETDEEIKEVLA